MDKYELVDLVLEKLNEKYDITYLDECYFYNQDYQSLDIDYQRLDNIISKINEAVKAGIIDTNTIIRFICCYSYKCDNNMFYSTVVITNTAMFGVEENQYGKICKTRFVLWDSVCFSGGFINDGTEEEIEFGLKEREVNFYKFLTKKGEDVCFPMQWFGINANWKERLKDNERHNFFGMNILFKRLIGLYNNLEDRIESCFKNNNFEESLCLLDEYYDEHSDEILAKDNDKAYFYYHNKSRALYETGKLDEALYIAEDMVNMDCIYSDSALRIKGFILRKKGEMLKALNCYAQSFEVADEERKSMFIESRDSLYTEVKDEFLDFPYEQRKLIFIADELVSTEGNEVIVLKKSDLPQKLNFPIGHPHLNKVYTCHPLRKDSYIPLEDFQKELFIDKVNEFTYLAQCLGATKVSIDASESTGVDSSRSSNRKLNVDADYKAVSGNFNMEFERKNKGVEGAFLQIQKVQTFNPTQAPYTPEDCLWLDSSISWQRLVNQRLNGNIQSHQEIVSISSNTFVSEQEIKNVNAELKILLAKAKGSYNKETEYELNTKQNYECKIFVEFADKNLLTNNNQQLIGNSKNINSADNELLEKYKEDILFMIEDDGVIDETERLILDRKIKKYGISIEDAKRVENELISDNYTEDELNYIEELKDIVEEGEVGEIELKMLDRYAKKFNVSAERQEVIHKIYLN